MSFLNQMSPEDADPFDEPEETDDTDSTDDGEKELRGVEKQIDSLLKDAECDASLTTKFSGTITMLIGRVPDREEDADVQGNEQGHDSEGKDRGLQAETGRGDDQGDVCGGVRGS